MFARLPSPSSLRTFEAAARLGSFKDAAAELGVTPTAVSHQIRALEDVLDVALFVRRTRAVELTEAGARLAPALHAAFLSIRTAVEDVAETEQVLTVTTTAAFATLRLMPRLPAFEARWPNLRLRVETGGIVVDLRRDRRIDVAIRYATEIPQGPHALPLVTERFAAYAAPGSTARDPAAAATLIETDMQQPRLAHVTWDSWFAAAGQSACPDVQILRYEEEHYVLQAAIAGHGLALMSSALVGDAVRQGLLVPVRPDITVPGPAGTYMLLCAPDRRHERKITRFMDWARETFATR
ncbi:MAG: LysR substrate-binding domain-containing protein [Pseudomonadota bacterium]